MQQTGMYNMDESSLTSVQRHGRVISVKGEKVGGMTRVVGGARRLECCSVTESGIYPANGHLQDETDAGCFEGRRATRQFDRQQRHWLDGASLG